MFAELIPALLVAGLPLLVITFGLTLWSIKNAHYIKSNEEGGELDFDELDLSNEDKKVSLKPSAKNLAGRFLSDKWLSFGGGYYGIMALGTYLHIQIIDWWETFGNFTSLADFIDTISVGFIVGLFIEAIKNMITAFVWFNYWPDYIEISNPWLWLLISYFGFTAGQSLAKLYVGKGIQFDDSTD